MFLYCATLQNARIRVFNSMLVQSIIVLSVVFLRWTLWGECRNNGVFWRIVVFSGWTF